MDQGIIQIYSGEGQGKSSAALGRAIKEAGRGKRVIIIQFLKGIEESEFVRRLEPEIKIFRFEKSEGNFDKLTEDEKREEIQNIKNGLNFAKKVLSTGECDLLILDELLGLLDNHIIEVKDLKNLLDARAMDENVIITGIQLDDETCALADEVFAIDKVCFKVF